MTKLTKNEKILRKASEKWKNFLAEGAFKKTLTEGVASGDLQVGDKVTLDGQKNLWTVEEIFQDGEVLIKSDKTGFTMSANPTKLNKSGLNEFDEDDAYHFDQDKSDSEPLPPEAKSATYWVKKGDKVRIYGLASKKGAQVPEEYKCKYGIVKGFSKENDREVMVQFDDGKVLSLDHSIMSKNPGTWKMDFFYPNCEDSLSEARMGEYGKMDAEQGLPPTKIGRGNEEYMAAYNAVLQARGEEPLDIQKPDQAFLDALRSGQLEENEKKKFKVGEFVRIVGGSLKGATGKVLEPVTTMKGEEGFAIELYSSPKMKVFGGPGDEVIATADEMESGGTTDGMELYDIDERSKDDERDLEKPVKYGSGAELEFDKKAQKFYDRKRDMYIDDKEEEDNLIKEKDEKEFAKIFARAEDMLVLSARSRVPVTLKSVQSALDVIKVPSEMEKGKLIVKNEYVIADKNELPETAKQISFTKYAMDYLSNLPGEQLDLPMEEEQVRTTMSSDPEMDQIEDIALTVIEKFGGLMSIGNALQNQGFDASISNGVLNIDGKYFMGKAENFDISPDEEVRKVGKYVLGYMG